MLNRRRSLVLGGSSLTLPLFAPGLIGPGRIAFAQMSSSRTGATVSDDMPPLLPGMEPFANDADKPIVGVDPLGTEEPPEFKKATALKIISDVMADPATRRPYDFALWFRDMGQGKYGKDYAPYARAWPTEYNPLVVAFFRATKTTPQGDTTSWCAAFINFCIALAVAKAAGHTYGPPGKEFSDDVLSKGTKSASSGSFRCWPGNKAPEGTSTPKLGDIVVWALNGTVNGCSYDRGHVAFFERFDEDRIIVIGGNQGPLDTSRQSGVTRRVIGKTFARSEGTVTFHSFRTADVLV